MKKMLMVVATTVALISAAYADGEKDGKVSSAQKLGVERMPVAKSSTNCSGVCTCGCEKSVDGVRRRVAHPWEARRKVLSADLSNTNVAVRVRRGNTKDSKPFIQKFDSSLTNGVKKVRNKERIEEMRKRREAKKKSKDAVFKCVRRAREYNRKVEAEQKRNGRDK